MNFFEKFMPFLVIGVAVVVGFIGLFLLSYVLIWGALIAAVLYLIAWVRNKFCPSVQNKTPSRGRTIDHE